MKYLSIIVDCFRLEKEDGNRCSSLTMFFLLLLILELSFFLSLPLLLRVRCHRIDIIIIEFPFSRSLS